MPVAWSAGWLLDQMVALETNPEKWWNKGGVVGFGSGDSDYDPRAAELPEGWEHLPFIEPEEV